MNYCYHYLISSRSSIKRSLKGWNCLIHFLKTPFIPPETSKSLLKKKGFIKEKNNLKVNLKNTVKKFLCNFIESIFQVTGSWSIAQMFSEPLTIEWSFLVLMNMGGLRNMRWASLSSWERVRVGLISSICLLGPSFYRLVSDSVYLIKPFTFSSLSSPFLTVV